MCGYEAMPLNNIRKKTLFQQIFYIKEIGRILIEHAKSIQETFIKIGLDQKLSDEIYSLIYLYFKPAA